MAARRMCMKSLGRRISHISRDIVNQNFLIRTYGTPTASAYKPDRPNQDLQEYVEIPSYPEIIDSSKEGRKKHARKQWYKYVQELPTVEQKLLEIISRQKYPAVILGPVSRSYDLLPFQQYCTRTNIIKGLPEIYQGTNVDDVYDKLKQQLIEVVKVQCCQFSRNYKITQQKPTEETVSRGQGGGVLDEMTSLISTTLAVSDEGQHLANAEISHLPRCDAFWWHAGFEKSKITLVKDIDDICFQYVDQPWLQVRTKNPLPEIFNQDDPACLGNDIPPVKYHPRVYGHCIERRYVTSVPGFWPGSECEYGYMSLHTRDGLVKRAKMVTDIDMEDCINGFGMMASFGWLVALATYQGFTPFNELTYPLVTQTVITNGQDWDFFVYQLNTMSFHSDIDHNTHKNICWTSGTMRLFEDIVDGEVTGLNDDVFKVFLKFFVQAPKQQSEFSLKPYTGEDTRSEEEKIADRERLRRLLSNRPNPFEYKHEVPLWKWIYKRHKDAPSAPFLK
ncbi:28S ribosomal protein S30, mitochondrial-like [Limulus polyphemus]|uniref:28S ribosomal protein S30, mitochondrial-like n=1 Tax=Limulus polyphemus TaxID=6850 RepID=A0ABM1BZH1_LIMPO|nr:28S ribosomal protein S30, mitochondrial-like [Limulus polyphemus]